MRYRTAGLAIAGLMAVATAGCTGASAVDGTAPAEAGDGQLPRVADDSGLGSPSPSETSAHTDAPDRATTVVPSPRRPGRANLADDPYLPPQAVIPADPGEPTTTTPSPGPSTTPPEDESGTETTRPTMPNPQRPRPLLPPDIGGPDLPDWTFGADLGDDEAEPDTETETEADSDTKSGPETESESEPETKPDDARTNGTNGADEDDGDADSRVIDDSGARA